MKEGTKTGDVVGRSSGRWLFLGDPGAIFFWGKLETDTKKEKRSKKERKRRPVETDAADGNPQRTRIPTAAWKAQNAFHSFHKARRRFYRRDLIHQQGGAKSNDRKGPNQVDGTIAPRSIRFPVPGGPVRTASVLFLPATVPGMWPVQPSGRCCFYRCNAPADVRSAATILPTFAGSLPWCRVR